MRIKMRNAYFWQISLLNLGLVGCTVGPKYEPPEMDIPYEWHSPASEGMSTASLDCFLWWESLDDPLLNSLIKRASLQNLDLYIAITRILEARAERKGGNTDLYPHIDGSINYGHVYYNKNTLIKDILGRSLPKNHRGSEKRNINFFEIGFDAEWEIDLFGAAAHEMNTLQAKLEASEEEFSNIWVTLSAEVARNYIELRGLQQRLDVIEKNIVAQKDTVHLTQELLRIGDANTIDLWQAEEQVNRLSAQKPLIELSIDKTIHRLSILLGYAPGDLFNELSEPGSLPTVPYNKPIGIPSELLRRRPDIRKAERELAAATESIGSAVAALFPRLSLRGFVGDISTHLQSLLTSASSTWFAGPQLLLPIFNSKLIMQDVDFNKIKTQQAFYKYQKTVLEALEETENAIASFHYELERSHYLVHAQRANEEAYRLTLDLYQRGLKDYLEVLVIDRSLLSTEDECIQSQIELLSHYISLYKALGGGWDINNCCVE